MAEVNLLAPAKLAADLEVRGIDNATELIERYGPADRIAAWISHFDRRREQDPQLRAGMLAAWIRGKSWPPRRAEPADKPERFAEARAWCKRHVPDLNQALAVGAYEVVRHLHGTEPTAAEIRERVVGRWGEEVAAAS